MCIRLQTTDQLFPGPEGRSLLLSPQTDRNLREAETLFASESIKEIPSVQTHHTTRGTRKQLETMAQIHTSNPCRKTSKAKGRRTVTSTATRVYGLRVAEAAQARPEFPPPLCGSQQERGGPSCRPLRDSTNRCTYEEVGVGVQKWPVMLLALRAATSGVVTSPKWSRTGETWTGCVDGAVGRRN